MKVAHEPDPSGFPGGPAHPPQEDQLGSDETLQGASDSRALNPGFCWKGRGRQAGHMSCHMSGCQQPLPNHPPNLRQRLCTSCSVSKGVRVASECLLCTSVHHIGREGLRTDRRRKGFCGRRGEPNGFRPCLCGICIPSRGKYNQSTMGSVGALGTHPPKPLLELGPPPPPSLPR